MNSMVVQEYELSPLQQGMLFHYLSGERLGTDVEQIVIDMEKGLDAARFEQAWGSVAARHEILRTSFEWENLAEPRQFVHETAAVPFENHDWRGLDEATERQRTAEFLRQDRRRGFDFRQAPLMRVTLFRLAEERYRAVWTLHHILLDGRSFVIALKEVFAVYEAALAGRQLRLDQPVPYRDYIDWIRGLNLAGGKEFWSRKLEGLTAPTPLPADRGAVSPDEGLYGQESSRLDGALSEGLRELAAREGLTLNVLVMGAWALLLSRYSGEQDVVFGATKTTRRSGLPQAGEMMGLLLATLPVRIRIDPGMPVKKWLGRLREEWISLRAYEHMPLVRIKEASAMPPSAPLFESLVMFEHQRFDAQLKGEGGPGWAARQCELLEQNNFPLTLVAYGDTEILLRLEYNGSRFEAADVERMLEHLRTLLESIAADPLRAVGHLEMLTVGEKHQILVEWNSTGMEYPDLPLHRLIEAQVERTPDRAAVCYEGRCLTYKELNARANQIAAGLRAAGVGPDSLVGICVRRSADMVAGLLAILKAGGAYVPIDPALPAERMIYMAEDSGLKVLLTESALISQLPDFHCRMELLDNPALATHASENVDSGATPRNLAYVIYTSGSTGKPKGVALPQSALINLLWSVREWFNFGPDDTLLAVTTISFDIAGVDLWLPLLAGARSVVASREVAANGPELMALMKAEDATFLQATPVTWRILLEAGWTGKRNLRGVCTGEAMPRELAEALRPCIGRLWNMYGPTETTIWSTGYEIRGPGPVLIGRPVGNTTTYIVDSQLQPVPVGVTGELLLGGVGLARGYLNRPELTAEKFIADSFAPAREARLYRTGDLARYLPDGNIECLGRTDHQVKIRGFRIELGEIEGALDQHPAVRQSVVKLCEDQHGKRLVGYLAPRDEEGPASADLRSFLARSLPDYMIPAQFVFVAEFPLTSSGKVNRLALPAPESAPSSDQAGYVAPRNELEQRVCDVWAEVFGLERVGIRDDFFDLGGHSLLAVQLLVRVQKIFPGEQIPLAALLEAPTIERFTAWLAGHRAEQLQLLVPLRRGGPDRPPFFCVHGAGGNVLSMRALAMSFPADLPFYALQAKGLDGSEPFGTVEETARCYVDEVQKVQPHGPYHLGGGCYGGLVAFEMARILEERGERVASLLMMDTYNLAFGRFLPKYELIFRNMAFYFQRLAVNVRKLVSLRPKLWMGYIGGRGRTLAWNVRQMLRLAGGAGQSQVPINFGAIDMKDASGTELGETLLRVRQASLIAAVQFVPKPYNGHATVFVATRRMIEPYRDKYLGWEPVVRGGIEAVPIEGDHDSIFEDPGVRPMGEKANAILLGAEPPRRSAAGL